jgi:hypothetical protein
VILPRLSLPNFDRAETVAGLTFFRWSGSQGKGPASHTANTAEVSSLSSDLLRTRPQKELTSLTSFEVCSTAKGRHYRPGISTLRYPARRWMRPQKDRRLRRLVRFDLDASAAAFLFRRNPPETK